MGDYLFRTLLGIFCLNCVAFAQEKQTILITAFDPFLGEAVNASEVVADAAVQLLANDPQSNIQLKICKLPVEFGTPADLAKACYESMNPRPTTVISMGETNECNLTLETKAANDDYINGKSQKVMKGPQYLPSSIPFEEIYCALPSEVRRNLMMSGDAGRIQCNDLMYRMLTYFKGMSVQYGFIHVPNYKPAGFDCGPHPSVNEDAKTLIAVLQSVVSSQAVAPAAPASPPKNASQCVFPEMNIPEFMSSDIPELLKKIKGNDDISACKREMLEKLNNNPADASQNK